MKETGQRRMGVPGGGPPAGRPTQEITVVQHYHPNPVRPATGQLPEVRTFNELPESSRYLHLHPVFKFVDSFLSSTSVHSKISGRVMTQTRRKCQKPSNASKCAPTDNVSHVAGDSAPKMCMGKRPKLAQCRPSSANITRAYRQERIKTNINNINSQNNMRISLKGKPCTNCKCGDNAPRKRIPETSENSMGIGSQYYVEQLKDEIKQSKTKLSISDDNYEYANKLKAELEASRSKYLDDARNIIDELKNEILNYRLQAKTKYSSSCSDLANSDKGLTANGQKSEKKERIERNQIGDKQGDVPDDHKDLLVKNAESRPKPFETLWKSKGSSHSSSDMETAPVVRNINFEEKLEEANSLIEKVRKALRDIGKGIYKLPEQTLQETDAPVKDISSATQKKDLVKEPSHVAETKDKAESTDTDRRKKLDETKVKQSKEMKEKKQRSEIQEASKEREEPKQLEEPKDSVVLIRQELQEHKEQKVPRERRVSIESKQETTTNESKEQKPVEELVERKIPKEQIERKTAKEEYVEVMKSKAVEAKQEDVKDARAQSEREIIDKQERESLKKTIEEIVQERRRQEAQETAESEFNSSSFRNESEQILKEDLTESMELLREKLRAISDMSESEAPSLKVTGLALKIERDSRDLAHDKSFEQREAEAQMKRIEFVRSWNEGMVTKESIHAVLASETSSSMEPKSETTTLEGTPTSKQSRKSKLSIQVMPPVTIRRGLVMQRTLHLSIKPTGSMINDLVAKSGNVGYEEIVVDGGDAIKKRTLSKCPEDCKNLENEYCKYKSADVADEATTDSNYESSVEAEREQKTAADDESQQGEPREKSKSWAEGAGRRGVSTGGLNEDALMLYKSFQILDPDKYNNVRESVCSLATLTQNIAKSVVTLETQQTAHRKSEQLAKIESVIGSTSGFSQRGNLKVVTGVRTPWDIGFYQTKSTQCSQTFLGGESELDTHLPNRDDSEVVEKVILKPQTPRSSSADEMPKTSSIELSLKDSITEPQTSPRSSADEESIKKAMKLERQGHSISSEQSSMSEMLQKFEPEKDDKPPAKYENVNLNEILSMLNEGKDASAVDSVEENIQKPTKTARGDAWEEETSPTISLSLPGKKAHVRKSASTTTSSTSTEDAKKSSSSESSTTSDDHQAEAMTKYTHSKRKRTMDSTPRDSIPVPSAMSDSIKTLQSPREENKRSIPFQKEFTKEQSKHEIVEKEKRPIKEKVEVYHEAKEIVKPLNNVPKVDVSLQVSLTTLSETSSDTSFYSRKERADTIAYFIKGLTGTSEDALDKLRSNPSFPKADISNWSRTVLKTVQEQNPNTPHISGGNSKQSMYEVSREKVMSSHDYVGKASASPKQPSDSVVTTLSEQTKIERLKQFQKMAQEAREQSMDRKIEPKVVMRVSDAAGEGEILGYSKRHLPFYRRVLGRILDPSSRKPMRTTQSDANPVEESISEGEIKCRSSPSIGEVIRTKYVNDRRKGVKSGRHFKNHPEDILRKELGEKSLRIARQRAQYNNWVTYYLQRQHNLQMIDDSSSQSPVNSSAQ